MHRKDERVHMQTCVNFDECMCEPLEANLRDTAKPKKTQKVFVWVFWVYLIAPDSCTVFLAFGPCFLLRSAAKTHGAMAYSLLAIVVTVLAFLSFCLLRRAPGRELSLHPLLLPSFVLNLATQNIEYRTKSGHFS